MMDLLVIDQRLGVPQTYVQELSPKKGARPNSQQRSVHWMSQMSADRWMRNRDGQALGLRQPVESARWQ